MKDQYTGAKRISGLHDMLSPHHRTNGDRNQMPVGDILKVGEGKGRLVKPSSSLQNLMGCTVPLEQLGCSNLPNFVSLHPKSTTIFIRSRGVGMVDDRSEPKRDVGARHLLLMPGCGDKRPEIKWQHCSV